MMGKRRFTIWVHRDAKSIFGPASGPVYRNGVLLSFEDEARALAECARFNTAPYTRYSVEMAGPDRARQETLFHSA